MFVHFSIGFVIIRLIIFNGSLFLFRLVIKWKKEKKDNRGRGIDKEREFWLLFDGSEDEEKPLGCSEVD